MKKLIMLVCCTVLASCQAGQKKAQPHLNPVTPVKSKVMDTGKKVPEVAKTQNIVAQNKAEAEKKANADAARKAMLLDMENNLAIMDSSKIINGKLTMKIKYLGGRAVEGLKLRVVSAVGESSFSLPYELQPISEFKAEFDAKVMEGLPSNNRRIKLIVDEGQYIR